MRAAVLTLAAAITMSGPLEAQPATPEMLARAASGMVGILNRCPQHFLVNGSQAKKTAETFIESLRQAVGERRATVALNREFARRKTEIDVTGERQWCAAQRAIMAPATVAPKIFID